MDLIKNKFLLAIILIWFPIISVFAIGISFNTKNITEKEFINLFNIPTTASNICQPNDSLELVKFKNNIPDLNWNLKDPINTWEGIIVNKTGCVTHIILNNKGLKGTITDIKLDSLIELELIGNKLGGSLPAFNNLKKLKALWLSNNLLTGSIPDFQLPNLESLDLSNNRLNGSIPAFNLNKLNELGLAFNSLSGSIPDLNTPKMAWIRLNNNDLTGLIPSWNFQDLQGVYLKNNKFTSSFPVLNLRDLRHISVDSNFLTGSIKGNFPSLWELNIASNRLSNISELVAPSLGVFYSNDNQLEGNFHKNFELWPNLNYLKLENNRLTFEPLIPLANILNSKMGTYSPQENIYTDSIYIAIIGKSFQIDLKMDDNITENIYEWTKDRKPHLILKTNKLDFLTFQLSDTGYYQVKVRNSSLPSLTLLSKEFKIIAPCLPVQVFKNDTICYGTSISFNGQNLTMEGKYTSKFISSNGCDSTVILNLITRPVINSVQMAYVEFCEIFSSVDISGGVAPFQYSWSNGRKEEKINNLLPDKTYWLTITDSKGCRIETSVITPSLLKLKIIPEFKIPNCEKENGEIKLNITGTKPYLISWFPSKGKGDTLRTGLTSGNYEVSIKDANNCLDTIRLTLEKPIDCKLGFKVYSSFSPNGDGLNDLFTIDPLNCNYNDLATCFPENELIIFNRWSDVVFKKSPYNNDWDAKGLPEGTYFYWFKATPEEKAEKSFITLINRK
jgi:gliding motility-associated-like protein